MIFQILRQPTEGRTTLLLVAFVYCFSLNSYAISKTNIKAAYRTAPEKAFACNILFPPPRPQELQPVAAMNSKLQIENSATDIAQPTITIPPVVSAEKIISSFTSGAIPVNPSYFDRLFHLHYFDLIT